MLVRPALAHLPAYTAALERGWSPDNLRPAAAQEELQKIAEDAERFVALMDDREALGGPVILPDGSTVPRLPGYRRWIWDAGHTEPFCGSLGLRWQPGTSELPAHVLGHLGYAIVPWRRREGIATRALALLLKEIDEPGLDYVEISTDPDNIASQKVALANGAVLVEPFTKGDAYGGAPGLRYRIKLR